MHCIFWKILVVSTENKFLFEDSFNVFFVRIIFLWFFMVFIMAYLWKGFSCGFYDFLHAIFVVMVFVVFCFNSLWFLWFLWFLWSLTFYSSCNGKKAVIVSIDTKIRDAHYSVDYFSNWTMEDWLFEGTKPAAEWENGEDPSMRAEHPHSRAVNEPPWK